MRRVAVRWFGCLVASVGLNGCALFNSGGEQTAPQQSGSEAVSDASSATSDGDGNIFSSFGESVLDFFGVTPPVKEFAQSEAIVEATNTLSREEEYYLGRAVAARVIAKYGIVSSPELTDYLTKLGLSLVSFSEKPETFGGYHFAVIDTDSFNAVSAPGGFIFVSRGLLEGIADEDELSAVLAHEISHVTQQHGIRSISQDRMQGVLEAAGLLVGSVSCNVVLQQAALVFGATVDEIVDNLLEKGYSREFEFEADRGATMLLVKAGLGTEGLKGVFLVLQSTESGAGGWFSTHPSSSERQEVLGSALDLERAPSMSALQHKAQRLARFNTALAALPASRS